MNNSCEHLTRAILTDDGRVLIQDSDGTFREAWDGTNWPRLDTMADADIDLTDAPEATPEMFASAVLRQGIAPVEGK